MKLGERIQCARTGRRGEVVRVSATGYLVSDGQRRFIVRKSVRGTRQLNSEPQRRKRKRKWKPDHDGGPINPELLALAERVKKARAT